MGNPMIGSYPFENIYIKSFELPQKKNFESKKKQPPITKFG